MWGAWMPVASLDEIRSKIGSDIGSTDWVEISQERIDAFADVTIDPQFIHVDPERAAAGPFGGTIAHGFLTLSMLSWMSNQVVLLPPNAKLSVNYGFERIRFIAPVRAGKRIRGHFRLASFVEKQAGQWQNVHEVTVEIEGEEKPALVAEWIGRIFT